MQLSKLAWRLIAGVFAVSFFTAGPVRAAEQETKAKEEDVQKVQAALPDTAPAKPRKMHKVLVFGRAPGFVHKTIPLGCETIKLLGEKTGAFQSVISFDPAMFDPENLRQFDGIVLVSNTDDFMDEADKPEQNKIRRQALLDFVQKDGKGLAGIHAAADSYFNWPQYGTLMGAYFTRHTTSKEQVQIVNEDPKNPINAAFGGSGFEFADEIYRFLPINKNGGKQSFSREKLHVLLSVDPVKNNNEPAGTDMPVAWVHQAGRGHVFYCSLGHNDYVYWNPTILKHFLAGIQYALGDLQVSDKPAQPTTPRLADVEKMIAALPDKAPAAPQKPRKVLAFGRATGFVHSAIPLGCKTVEMLGKKTGAFDTVISYDPAIFTADALKQFDAIVLVSTTGDFLDADGDAATSNGRRQALFDFVNGGKGLAGIHAAGDAYYKWPQYGEMIGGYFNGHPWQKVTVKIDDPANPITAPFNGQEFTITDETYTYKKDPWSRDKLHLLLSIDVTKFSDADRKVENRTYDHDYGLSWIHRVGEGRVFYAAHGHKEEIYANRPMLEHYLAGIQYAIGDLKADDTPAAAAK